MNRPINPWKITGYKAGQTIACKVVAQEPGGYAVLITKDNLSGFLPIEAKLRIGEEVLAQFVCVHNNRVLLSSRMAGTNLNITTTGQPQSDWRKELEASKDSEASRAFQVWAKEKPINFRLRRAVDLILPPLDQSQVVNKIKVSEGDDLLWLVTDLEGGMRTACVKVSCEPKKSRSAALIYKGRVVGCIYGNKELREPLPTENSLQKMLEDCQTPDTDLLVYGLAEEIILPMSALFLGYPVERSDDLDARSYMDYIMGWLAQKEQTACLAFSLPKNSSILLVFIHKGQYVGAFYVETQEFSKDINFVYNFLAQDSGSKIEVSILPPELISSAVKFGFSLSMAMPR